MKRIAVLLAGVTAVLWAADVGDESKTLRFDKKRLFVTNYQAANVADIDKDGKLDIVSGPYWFAAPNFEPHAFRANPGSKDFVHSNSDLPYDIDGDGWTDVIVGAWDEEGILCIRTRVQQRSVLARRGKNVS